MGACTEPGSARHAGRFFAAGTRSGSGVLQQQAAGGEAAEEATATKVATEPQLVFDEVVRRAVDGVDAEADIIHTQNYKSDSENGDGDEDAGDDNNYGSDEEEKEEEEQQIVVVIDE